MSLTVNLRHLEAHPLRLAGELSVEELDIDPHDEVIRLARPLIYDLEVQKLEKAVLVQGRLHLDLEQWACHVPLQGEEHVAVVNDCVDLTPQVREDILLEFPRHPVCGPECRGLPKTSIGESRNTSTTDKPGMSLPAWAELNKLKL